MKIIFFTKYTTFGASSRYRTFQYLPTLQEAGGECTALPFFDDAYLTHKYAHGRSALVDVLRAFFRRLRTVLTVPRGAVVMVEYELLPFFSALLEHWLVWRGCHLVVDYDDALFHQYDQHISFLVRRFLGNKIARVMQLADTVVAGNAYLADYARRAGARRVVELPTVVDLERYPTTPPAFVSDVFTIGWIGSPTTARYLRDIMSVLAGVCNAGRSRVRLIGSGAVHSSEVPVEVIPWRDDTEVAEMRFFDVGIMPLPDEPWARGKCGFKLIQYMACGLPVVASPVGVNCQIVEHGVNGFLASTAQEWEDALHTLRQDPSLRKRMGQAGRKKVEEQYCLQVTAPKFAKLLHEAGNSRVAE